MDCAWDREHERERCATRLSAIDRGRVFGCVTPLCPADVVCVAIPHAGNPRPRRPAHYRTKAGSRHSPDCAFADEPDRALDGSTPASRPDGPPTTAPGRIVFDRHGTTAPGDRDGEASPARRSRSTSRTGDSGLADHLRSCRSIRPACEYLLGHPDDLDLPLELPHLGSTTYRRAFAPIPAASGRPRGWRIWRAALPFTQRPTLINGRLRIEPYAGWGDRRFVTVDCSRWTGGLDERLEATVRDRLAAVRATRREGGRLGCQLFAFAPEPAGRDDIVVSHPAMLCLVLAERPQAKTSAFSDQRASSLEIR